MKKTQAVVINKAFAAKVLGIVDKGLSYGLGQRIPGQMCVEAAVAFASGEEHDDAPTCVDTELARIKIELNDIDWKDNKSRAKGLRRLAIAQLGSKGKFNYYKFWEFVENSLLVLAKEAAIKEINKFKELSQFEDTKFWNGILPTDISSVGETTDALYQISSSAKEEVLFQTAEIFTQALIAQKIPGTKFLYLTKKKKVKRKAPVKAKSKTKKR